MAQGKFKVKSKVPNQKQKQKGKAFTRRSSEYSRVFFYVCFFSIHLFFLFIELLLFQILDAPIQSKKHHFNEQQKLKQLVSKNVNRSVEEEIRGRAKEGHINLSKAQEAVAKQQKEKTISTTATK